jgi:hypothetical protein
MTVNPNDPDIMDNLPRGVPTYYMPHLVTRVAYLKFKRLMDEVVKDGTDSWRSIVCVSFANSADLGIFGKVISWTYVIEFQKRGLPHIHALITLAREYKWHKPEGNQYKNVWLIYA